MEFKTGQLAIEFGADGLTITRLRNLATKIDLCSGGRQTFLARTPTAVSEPILFTEVESVHRDPAGLRLRLCDQEQKARLEFRIELTDKGLALRAELRSGIPFWMLEWSLSGLDLADVLVPGLGGQRLDGAMPEGTHLAYKYPFWWNARFVIGRQSRGGCWLYDHDPSPTHKLLRIKRSGGTFNLTWGREAPAPLKAEPLVMEWFLEPFTGDWRTPVESYRAWMEKTYTLKRLDHHPRLPAWAGDINIILEMWGAHRENPAPGHSFAQMRERLRAWSRIHPPARTLVYLPGFAEHGIDSHAPDYHPSPQCGGPEEFRTLINSAHDLGYHVMVHTNVLALTYDHPLFQDLARCQVVDPFGRPQGWGMDLDGDWLAEPYFAYVNPGYSEWTEQMTGILGELIEGYGIDAVFLDQTLLSFNDSRGPNFLEGMVKHIRRLQAAFPATLFAGEGLHEYILSCLPMAQIHGLDSIPDVHALDGVQAWRHVHPVSACLFGKYTRLTGHLLTRNPADPRFKRQEAAYAKLGVIPVLSLYNSRETWEHPALERLLKRARNLSGSSPRDSAQKPPGQSDTEYPNTGGIS